METFQVLLVQDDRLRSPDLVPKTQVGSTYLSCSNLPLDVLPLTDWAYGHAILDSEPDVPC